VYASQPALPPDHATLGSGWSLAFAGRGWLPAGSHREVSSVQDDILLTQALPGALSAELLTKLGWYEKIDTVEVIDALAAVTFDPR